jgi:hypothetical protein
VHVAHLVPLNQVGGIIVARKCSGCGEILLEPTMGSTPGEKGTILIDEFMRHVAKAHKKKIARADLE